MLTRHSTVVGHLLGRVILCDCLAVGRLALCWRDWGQNQMCRLEFLNRTASVSNTQVSLLYTWDGVSLRLPAMGGRQAVNTESIISLASHHLYRKGAGAVGMCSPTSAFLLDQHPDAKLLYLS